MKAKLVLTFHNSELKKQEYVELYKKQRKAGKLIQGEYFCQDTGNACLIGTIAHGKNHQLMAQQTGLPDWLIYLSEFLFENLPQAKYETFPETFFQAIPTGATQEQLQVVWHKLAIFLLEEIIQFDRTKYTQVRASIETVIALHRQEIEKPNSTPDAAWTVAETTVMTAAGTAARTAVVSKIADKLIELLY